MSKFYAWLETEVIKQNMQNNIFPPGMDAQTALNMLTSYLLGDDWYITYPGSQSQVNTEIVYCILEKYSKKFKKELKQYRKKQL